MRERFEYDLGNASFTMGKMGCLSILNVIPVIPGDSISIDAIGVVKLYPFRRQIILVQNGLLQHFMFLIL